MSLSNLNTRVQNSHLRFQEANSAVLRNRESFLSDQVSRIQTEVLLDEAQRELQKEQGGCGCDYSIISTGYDQQYTRNSGNFGFSSPLNTLNTLNTWGAGSGDSFVCASQAFLQTWGAGSDNKYEGAALTFPSPSLTWGAGSENSYEGVSMGFPSPSVRDGSQARPNFGHGLGTIPLITDANRF